MGGSKGKRRWTDRELVSMFFEVENGLFREYQTENGGRARIAKMVRKVINAKNIDKAEDTTYGSGVQITHRPKLAKRIRELAGVKDEE